MCSFALNPVETSVTPKTKKKGYDDKELEKISKKDINKIELKEEV